MRTHLHIHVFCCKSVLYLIVYFLRLQWEAIGDRGIEMLAQALDNRYYNKTLTELS